MNQMQKLWKLFSITLASILILTSCEVVNIHKFTKMYINAFTLKENNQYAKYTQITTETFNESINDEIYSTLIRRVTTIPPTISEEDLKAINDEITDFRKNQVRIVFIDANEKEKTARVKVYITDTYDLVLESLNSESSGDNTTQVVNSFKKAFKDSKRVDSIEVTIKIEVDEITGKYYVSEDSQDNIIKFILGLT